ncbi:MAG: Glu/Leu/Phe/Val dehydrogenase [bacterium]|nr:Glu/Leu/Phe/Val dehydrogenase [bacterium]
MKIFQLMKQHNQEQVAFYTDKSVKLRAILAIDSTTLGPAIGGVRIYKYKTVDNALFDLYRLSRAMTHKAAAGGLNFGGGYVVIVDREGMEKKESLFRSLGRFIESFKGRFIAGGEIGVTEENAEYIHMETEFITGLPSYFGGSGNHSYMGAYGTLQGILAAAKYKWGTDSLEGKTVAVQGYGRTGSLVAQFVRERGARVMVAEIVEETRQIAKEKGFDIIPAEDIYSTPCDILAPCAVGFLVTPGTAEQFQCRIVAGAANNQLLKPDDDRFLKKRGIIYAPDFIINVGGVIDMAEEYLGYKKERATRKTENIHDRLLEILKFADDNDMTANQAAIQYALKRIEDIKQIKGRERG